MLKPTFKSWQRKQPPTKILAIRYQALGDVVITLPYLNDLHSHYHDASFYFLTLEENASIPQSISFIKKTFVVRGGRNTKFQLAFTLLLLPTLWREQFDIVIDLQNHQMSRLLIKLLRPIAWTKFDRFSPQAAGERVRQTINNLGLGEINLNAQFTPVPENSIDELLTSAGMRSGNKLIIINPAGAFETRNWSLQNYVKLIQLLSNKYNSAQFLVLGFSHRIGKSLSYIQEHTVATVIDLTNKTTAAQAFAIVNRASILITEDSGLMHMAWVQNVPTLALFGSTRSDWSAPLGDRSVCLNSSDLPCGNCMLEKCIHHDNRCLTRYSPELVFDCAVKLLER